jgi:hypothetical protein
VTATRSAQRERSHQNGGGGGEIAEEERAAAEQQRESSEQEQQVEEFTAPFAHVRRQLDYAYHFKPTLERQHVQDAIISRALDRGVESDDAWLLFTAGAMGAGKSWCMKRLSERGYFNEACFVIVDPDDIRYIYSPLPTWALTLFNVLLTRTTLTHCRRHSAEGGAVVHLHSHHEHEPHARRMMVCWCTQAAASGVRRVRGVRP